jgi:cbb3-type cytochrome c oxidase subunit III
LAALVRTLAPLVLLALSVLLAAACGTVGRTAEGNMSRGKQLFTERCGSCHALADAGTRGRVGPDLDEAFVHVRGDEPGQGFKESTIRDVVRGQIAYPVEDPVTDAPGMPANLVTGEDADAVAAYVASVAGLPVRGGGGAQAEGDGGAGAGGATDGRAIFTTNCASCHTLAAAGTSGTIGPNLDEARPSRELAVERVTNGKGAMPAFKGQLSEQQIQAVAAYVAENAGG